MAKLLPRKKALSVSPLKVSQPVGGSLAFLGLRGAMPLMHGSQGCTAFAKVFFVRHFREPIPLQTTAMDQISAVMGADESIVEALSTICKKSKPEVIGLVSTGLSEVQGCDLRGSVKKFRERHPEFSDVAVVPVNTPDFSGCFETGYAAALLSLLKVLVPERHEDCAALRTVNVLASSMLTPGDLEEIEELLLDFGLQARVVPHLGESLSGELTDKDFSPITIGGTKVSEVAQMGRAAATLVVGPSLTKCGALLEQRTGVKSYYFDHLHTLSAMDRFVAALLTISGRASPSARLMRKRRQLTDAMLDTHFGIGKRRFAVAGDPDLVLALTELSHSMGAEMVATVVPSRGEAVGKIPISEVKVGDLEDLRNDAREGGAQLLFGNSHAVDTAERLKVPLIRCGFPLYDTIGAYARRWVGYGGVRQTLFDIANTLHEEALDEVPAYVSKLSQKIDESPCNQSAG